MATEYVLGQIATNVQF